MPIPTHKGLPIPSGRVHYWGVPYHGLIRNGQMQLPNGSTRAHTQPENGSTVVVKNSRLAGVPATRTLASYDAAQGFSWLTFAILSGSNKMIAGEALGGLAFIYVDHRDRPWLMDVYAVGAVWYVRVLRRFGLFGQDSVSWITNRVIYSGNFAFSGIWDEYLVGDDLCQNWDGSSVYLNLRTSLSGSDKIMPGLSRVVELNITSVDAGGSPNDVTFNLGHSHRLANAEITDTKSDSYDTRPETSGYSCGRAFYSSVDYSSDEKLSSYCGPGAARPGSYTEQGSVAAVNQWEDGSGQYGTSSVTHNTVKIWWNHDNAEQVMTLANGEIIDSEIADSCSFGYAANFQLVNSTPANGDTNSSGFPCSGLASINWSVQTAGNTSTSTVYTTNTHTFGGIYINGVEMISWHHHAQTIAEQWGTADLNFSASGSFTEGDPPGFPQEFYDVRDECINGIVDGLASPTGQTTDSGNSYDSTQSTIIDGVSIPETPDFSPNNQFIRQYANDAFSLVLISLTYPEGDPQEPAYFGQYGLWVEGQKVVIGKMADKTLDVTAHPVDGTVTIDYNEPVCYA